MPIFLEKKHTHTHTNMHTSVSQNFCNNLVLVSLQRVCHTTEAAQAVEGTLCGW